MTPNQRSFSVDQIGGKAASLARLAAIPGVRVPPWFAIPADELARALDAAGVTAAVDAALARLAAVPADQVTAAVAGAAAAELAALVGKVEVSPALRADLQARLAALGGAPVAVRSSGIDEDGADRSFAGQHDTLLFVDDAGLADAVAACWRSAFGERALFYRARLGLLDRPIRIAVVVQRMIDGAVSGVLFSADASSGDRTTMVVTSTWGLGEGVVSGRLACDTFTVTRAGDGPAVASRDVVDKTHAIRAASAGTAEVPVDAADAARPSLGDDDLLALARLAEAIEAAYGHPVDLEWTIDATGPWLLQARPITSLPPPPRGRRRLWDNSNIIESYSGVTTPMTYSFARRAYGMVYRQAFALLGVPRREIEANGAVFEQMIGLLHGRVYYNLESWYRALQLLPGYKFNAEFMEQMMGVREGASFGRGDAAPRSAARRYLVDLPELVASLGVLAARFARAQRLVDGFFDEFGARHAGFWDQPLEDLSLDELVEVYLDAERTIMGRWQAPIVNDILAMIFFGALRKALTGWGLGDASLHNDLLCGEGGLESTEPTRDLLALAADLRRDAPLAAMLRAATPAEARARVHADPRWGWLKTRLALHVDRYGDRCIDELKLEQSTLRDDDTFLYATLKGYLAAPPVTVEDMDARERAIRAAAEARVAEALGKDVVKRRLFRFLVDGARRHVKNRENLRFARTRAFGLVRRIVVAMGHRLVDAGRLDAPGDVFYVEIGELIALARGTATTTDLRGLAAVRQAEYARYRDAAPPEERFWTTGATYLDPALARLAPRAAFTGAVAAAGEVLQGVAAAPGRVTAKARLVHDPRGVELAGDVLIANRTDPGWVPLFPSARAVVVERGSVLSHSAIVAREFGIPCVVGLRDALARIPDGAIVEVDGGAGTVRIA